MKQAPGDLGRVEMFQQNQRRPISIGGQDLPHEILHISKWKLVNQISDLIPGCGTQMTTLWRIPVRSHREALSLILPVPSQFCNNEAVAVVGDGLMKTLWSNSKLSVAIRAALTVRQANSSWKAQLRATGYAGPIEASIKDTTTRIPNTCLVDHCKYSRRRRVSVVWVGAEELAGPVL